ncbi:MAG: sugar transferase [Acidobacteria bacterium]|nr:sugar transferase [Acidobacteriota bacterium]
MIVGYVLAILLLDAFMLGAAFRLAYWIRFELRITISPEVVPSMEYYFELSMLLLLGCMLLFALTGLYNWHNLMGGTAEYSKVFNSCTIAFTLAVFATFVLRFFGISRGWLLTSWFVATLLVGTARFSMRRVVYALRERGFFLVPAVVVGLNGESAALAAELKRPRSGYRVMGLVGISGRGARDPVWLETDLDLPVLGTLEDLEQLVQEYGIRELVVSATALHRDELFELYERVNSVQGLELRLSTGLFELLTTGVQVRTAGAIPLIGLRKMRLDPVELVIKTAVEYTLTVAGLIVLSPFLALIAIGIKLDSPGPVIYRRRVLGIGGREFDAFKFRTMRIDSDRILAEHPELLAELQEQEKIKEDPRITRLGYWLRKFSLDELPQLFNVLLGQMSLVGPRMISPPEAERYGRNRYNLLTVRPGITGLWQVSGRSDLSYQERVRLDMYYIRNYSIWLDFHILFVKTVNAVLSGRGAY